MRKLKNLEVYFILAVSLYFAALPAIARAQFEDDIENQAITSEEVARGKALEDSADILVFYDGEKQIFIKRPAVVTEDGEYRNFSQEEFEQALRDFKGRKGLAVVIMTRRKLWQRGEEQDYLDSLEGLFRQYGFQKVVFVQEWKDLGPKILRE